MGNDETSRRDIDFFPEFSPIKLLKSILSRDPADATGIERGRNDAGIHEIIDGAEEL